MSRLVFGVPALRERPLLGASCCVSPAAAAIERSLSEWVGVEAVAVDEARGEVEVWLSPMSGTEACDLAWSLEMLGLEVERSAKTGMR